MNCVNKTHPEFIALQEQTGIPTFVLAAKVSSWQEKSGITDRFPTPAEVTNNMSESELAIEQEKIKSEKRMLSPKAKATYITGKETDVAGAVVHKILSMNRDMDLKIVDGESFYVDIEGNRYERVSSVIGNTFTGDSSLYSDNAQIGSEIHKMAELINIGEDVGVVMAAAPSIPEDIRTNMYEYLNELFAKVKADGSVLLSEMIIGDKESGIAGTVDMIRVKPNGEVSIIDFKTSNSSTADNKYVKKWTGNGITRSKKDQHTAQLSAYHRIMEKSLGLSPVGRSILPIWLKSEDGVITDNAFEEMVILPYDETMGNVISDAATDPAPETKEEPKPESETKKEQFANTPQNKLDKVLKEAKIFVQGKLDQLSKTSIRNKDLHEKRLKRIQEALNTIEAAEGISAFINDAYENFYGGEGRPSAIDQLTAKMADPKDAAETLAYTKRFLDSYDILDELRDNLVEEKLANLRNPKDDSAINKLVRTIAARDALRALYKDKAIPAMAADLFTAKGAKLDARGRAILEPMIERSTKSIEDAQKMEDKDAAEKIIKREQKKLEEYNKVLRDATFTQEDLQNMLTDIGEDQSVLEYLFSPLISSSEAPMALFAKFVKNKLEDARMAVLNFKHSLDIQFNEFQKATGRARNNPATFNKGIYTTVTNYYYDKESKTIKSRKTMEYVQEFDVTAYSKSKAEMFKAADGDGKVIAKWFAENHKDRPADEVNSLILEKRAQVSQGIISADEYQLWADRNFKYDSSDNIVGYKGDLTEPRVDKYKSQAWSDLQLNKPVQKYHKFLLDNHLKQQEELPEAYRIGHRLWSIRKSDTDKIIEGNGKAVVKNWWAGVKGYRTEDSQQYGNEAFGVHEVPVHFTEFMEAGEVSLDLYQASLMATEMVERYKALTDIVPEAELMKSVYANKQFSEKDSLGRTLKNKAADILGMEKYLTSKDKSNSSKQLEGFINKIFYDERNIKWTIGGLPLDKIAGNLMAASALTTIAGDALKGFANFAQGKIQVAIEAASKEFFSGKDYLQGKIFYDTALPAMLGDFGIVGTKSMGGQLMELYDAIQGEFLDKLGKNMTGNTLKKAMSTDSLFFNQTLGEHSIQGQALFAYLHAIKVKNAKGESVPLLYQYELGVDGRIKLKDGTVFTDEDRKDAMNTIHAMNKRLHGVYNEFDKAEAQRYLLGRLALMYRKFVVPGYKKRFKSLGADQELGSLTAGYYMTFYKTMISDLREGKYNVVKNWSTYSDFEKTNLLRFYTEAGTIVALMGIIAAIKGADDDDEKNGWAYNFALYQALRLKSEMSFYSSIPDAVRILKSPSPIITQIESVGKAVGQLAHPFEVYKRDAGKAHKGDNKLGIKLQKLIGLSGNNLNPDQAVKILEMY